MGFPASDPEYRDLTVTAVDVYDGGGCAITGSDGWSFGVPDDSPIKPAVGMPVRFYGRGIGYVVRGLFLDGREVFYRSDSEQRDKDRRDQEERDRERKYDHERDQADFERRTAALPAPLRDRLAAFRSHNPDFGWKYEGYELAVSELAARLAESLITEEAVKRWATLDYADQVAAVPVGDGFTGNMVGCATLLARALLSDPRSVPLIPGAMSPLVGSSEFLPPTPV